MNDLFNYLIPEIPFIPDEEIVCMNEIKLHYTPFYPLTYSIPIKSAEDAYKALFPLFEPLLTVQELFVVLYLNAAGKVIGIYSMSKGGICSTVVDIRLVLAVALKGLATSIILCHNHPSGSLQPSKTDEIVTEKLVNAAKYHDLRIRDHLIIGEAGKYLSFANEGML